MDLSNLPFSFPVFYAVVFRDNTFVPNQYDVVNYLLFGCSLSESHSGQLAVSDKTASQYALGARPIGKVHRYSFLGLSVETIKDRIGLLHLRNPENTANALMALIRSGRISLSTETENNLIEWSKTDETDVFLSKALRAAIESDYTNPKPLDKKTVLSLVAFRENYRTESAEHAKNEKSVPAKAETETGEELPESIAVSGDGEAAPDYDPGAVVQDISVLHDKMNTVFEPSFPEENRHPTEWPDPNGPLCVHSYYEFRRLTYAKEFKRLDRFFREFQPFDDDMKYPVESVDAFRSIFYRSKATFEIKVIGDYCGITDAVLSRVKRNSCSQMAFIVKLQGRTPLSLLRSTLQNIIHFALAEDGYVLFSYAQDDHVPLRHFAVTCIYSINEFSGDDELRQESIFDHNGLLPVEDYRKSNGRIPAFFGPISTKNDGYDVQRERW